MRRVILSALLAGAIAGAGAAQARPESAGWQVSMGAGSLYSPIYEGDDEYSLSVLPNIQLRYKDRFFASVQEGIGYNLVRTPGWVAGPLVKIRFSRDEDGDRAFAVSGRASADLTGLGDVATSIEPGGFVRYRARAWSLGAEMRQAVTGHEGLVLDLDASLRGRGVVHGRAVNWSAGPRVRLADGDHNNAYFGVTSAQSLRSGLPAYSAGSGLYSYGANTLIFVPLDQERRWSGVVFAGYDRLAGDTGRAPLIRLRGDRDQFSAGIFLNYTFN